MAVRRWTTYVRDVAQDDDDILQQYHNDGPRLFSPGASRLEIMELTETGLQTRAVHDPGTLQEYLPTLSQKIQTVIYLVYQDFTLGRFQLAMETFNQILEFEKVFFPYLQTVRAFGSRLTENQTAGFVIHACISKALNGNLVSQVGEFCYNLPYPALNERNRGCPWSQRLTGVYHQLNFQTLRSCWILLQVSENVRKRIEVALNNARISTDRISRNPMVIHLLLLSSTEIHWTGYIEYLITRLDELDQRASFSRVGKECENDYTLAFSDYQHIHLLRQKLSKASSNLTTCYRIAIRYENMCKEINSLDVACLRGNLVLNGLDTYKAKIEAHQRAVITSIQRLEGTATLLMKIIEFRGVETLRETNRAMHGNLIAMEAIATQTRRENETLASIARQTQRDSIALKALTLIATVYLPATLVATVFSSNLISTVPSAIVNGREIAAHFSLFSQFWVYVLVTLVLTAMTLVGFRVLNYQFRKG